MKGFICLILALIFISQVQSNQQARDLVIGYFKTVLGHDWHLNEECLGDHFDSDVQNVIKAINNLSPPQTLSALVALQNRINQNCPLKDFNQVQLDAVSRFLNGQIFRNLKAHGQELLITVRDELIKSEHSAYEAGNFLGNLTNQAVYGKSINATNELNFNILSFFTNNLAFVEFDIADPLTAADGFVEGILIGVAKDPANNKCNKSLEQYKGLIKAMVYEGFYSFKNKIGWYEAFVQTYNAAIQLPNTPECKFKKLGDEIISSTTMWGKLKFTKRIGTNLKEFTPLIGQVQDAVSKQDWRQIGIIAGKIFQIALDYQTE